MPEIRSEHEEKRHEEEKKYLEITVYQGVLGFPYLITMDWRHWKPPRTDEGPGPLHLHIGSQASMKCTPIGLLGDGIDLASRYRTPTSAAFVVK